VPLVARCCRQLIGAAGWVLSLSQWPTGFFQCYDAVGWVMLPVKIVPEMTYKVSSGTLNLCSLTHSLQLVLWITAAERENSERADNGRREEEATVGKTATKKEGADYRVDCMVSIGNDYLCTNCAASSYCFWLRVHLSVRTKSQKLLVRN